MGVKGLYKFLKDNCPSAFFTLELKELREKFNMKKIAIDISCIMYKYMSICRNNEIDKTNLSKDEINKESIFNNWVAMMLDNCRMFLEKGIIPVYVFDGKPIEEKGEEVTRRNELRKNKLNEIEMLLDNLNIEEKKEMTIEEKKDLLKQNDIILSKKMKQVVDLPQSYRRQMYNILDFLGLPVIQASHDAEKTCSMLQREEKVDIIYTTDSDAFVFGANIVINDIKRYGEKQICSVVVLSEILKSLNMSREQFRDFCILCGTDYNRNIRNIGPVKSCKAINKYIDIERFLKDNSFSEDQIQGLNYLKCRKIYEEIESDKIIIGHTSLAFNYKNTNKYLEKILKEVGLDNYINHMKKLILNLKPKIKLSKKMNTPDEK